MTVRPDTLDDLLRIPNCTPDKLDGLESAGVIPKGEQVHPPGRRGSATVYPPGTASLVEALLAHRKAKPGLDNRELGLDVWWEGYPVPIVGIRGVLIDAAESVASEMQRLLDHADGDPLRVGEEMAAHAGRQPKEDRLARRRDIREMKRNVDDLDTFTLVAVPSLVLILYGEQPEWSPEFQHDGTEGEESKEQVIASLMGVARMATQTLPDGKTFIPEIPSIPDLFDRLQRAIVDPLMDNPREMVCGFTDDEIVAGRDIARALIDDGGAWVSMLERTFGRGAFGFGILRAISEMSDGWRRRALLIVTITAMRRAWSDDENENLDSTCRSFTEIATQTVS